MYNILVVDDEPLICKGLSRLIASSGLCIRNVFTANSGYEGLEYLRIEEIDLLVTDIQMCEMSGIELMRQAKILNPWVELIIISDHKKFHYAQMAIRLGVKDYLLKPLSSEQFLDSVRRVLLHMDRPTKSQKEWGAGLYDHFCMEEPRRGRSLLLKRLLEEPYSVRLAANGEASGIVLAGPYFAFLRIQLLETEDKRLSSKDDMPIKYAILNVASELLDREWYYEALYLPGGGIGILIQWSDAQYEDPTLNKLNQLDLLGRSLHFHINKFVKIPSVIGLSQILRGPEFLPTLYSQATRAVSWYQRHPDHYVFYYGDFKWSIQQSDPTDEEWSAHNNLIVEQVKQYIHEHYTRKGLTVNEVALHNHVSPNYLSYLFKKNMNINLWEYVIKLRIEESKRLLTQTDLRRYEIAERVGYASPEHFSKIFKKYYGVSPSELKK